MTPKERAEIIAHTIDKEGLAAASAQDTPRIVEIIQNGIEAAVREDTEKLTIVLNTLLTSQLAMFARIGLLLSAQSPEVVQPLKEAMLDQKYLECCTVWQAAVQQAQEVLG